MAESGTVQTMAQSGTVNDLANISRVWNPPISDTQRGLIFSSLQCHLKFLFTLIHFLKCRILKVCLNELL